jgi:3-phosphoshikimate 1-carboxyvinyltransferase
MGQGETTVGGYLDAADTRATLEAVRRLGAGVEASGGERAGAVELRIAGIGLRGAGESCDEEEQAIDVGNAGTLLRLLPGWLAGQGAGAWTLDGDESIRRRPVDRVAEPLALMGAEVSCRDGRLPPLRVRGAELRGISYRLPVASAQVKSCVLIAGLLAAGETQVVEPATTRDHTERMLAAAGAEVEVSGLRSAPSLRGGPATRITVRPAERLALERVSVPGDFSSAAFPIVAAAIVAGSDLELIGVGLNPSRVGLLGILNRMGAAIEVREDATGEDTEARGTIAARHGALTGTRVHADEVPLAIDELPLVALAGCFAEGRTVVAGAAELRHKESDRIAAVVDGLAGIGAQIEALEDGFVVHGTGGLRGGRLDARGDHRLAMLGAVAGLASRDGVEVAGAGAMEVSYPSFAADLRSLLRP